MVTSLPLYPVWLVDVMGATSMIVLSFLCVRYAHLLRLSDSKNVIWTYLLWLSLALALFSLSRSIAHIAKRVLLLTDNGDIWLMLRPVTGSINTLTFVIVSSITLFFQRVYRVNVQILNDKEAIERASEELLWLNRNLEEIVRQRTAELSASEKNYRRIFEASMDIILILDRTGKFLDINQAGLNNLGYGTKTELVGTSSLADLVEHPVDCQKVLREIAEAGFKKNLECRLRRRDGEILTWLFTFTVNRGLGGEVETFEGIAKDITERKKMEQQLLQADRLASLGQLSAGVAHEINNPLGLILGYTQLLLRSEPGDTQTFADLKIIEKHAQNCKVIVEDLLNFARSSESQKGPVNINDLLRETVAVVQHQFALDNVVIETHYSAGLPTINADGEKLKQVFMNLFMNARQAIEHHGTIRIHTGSSASRHWITISVADTGVGIPAPIVDKIFDPFFTTKPTGQGTGLGLSVSYGIIKDHQGEITVESTPGEGSIFTIRLPVRPEREYL
ncbi:MAG: PAS domain S-box protein [Deltaproteobacteria bacterium]|nr:PAS domain S-box protein [Deltaproteobacteria bacterium]MBW2070765.1 PAS domain S-box protein [Deltaproteobacteria bacterium]